MRLTVFSKSDPYLRARRMVDQRDNLNVTVGALLIGCLITAVYVRSLHSDYTASLLTPRCILSACRGYGVTTLQTYMYISRFPRDPAYLKIIVSRPCIHALGCCTPHLHYIVGQCTLVSVPSSDCGIHFHHREPLELTLLP